jgi:hypothetical protein
MLDACRQCSECYSKHAKWFTKEKREQNAKGRKQDSLIQDNVTNDGDPQKVVAMQEEEDKLILKNRPYKIRAMKQLKEREERLARNKKDDEQLHKVMDLAEKVKDTSKDAEEEKFSKDAEEEKVSMDDAEKDATVDVTEINDPAKVAEEAVKDSANKNPADLSEKEDVIVEIEVQQESEEDIVTLAGDVTIPKLFPGGIALTVKGIVMFAQEKLTILWVDKTVNQSQDAILSFYDWSKSNWPIKIQMVALVI